MPVSRILYPVWVSIIYLFCLPFSTYNDIERATLFPWGNRNIRGISAHKVYPLLILLLKVVGSYPTFSPFPQCKQGGSYFLRHFLSPTLLLKSIR